MFILKRIKTMEEKIYQIPKNLNDCFTVLTEIFNESESDRDWFKKSTEDEAIGGSHHGIGRWIRNTWGLWEKNTELFDYFKNLGLWHADDMSGVILTSYHRFLNGKELNLQEQIQHYLDFWKEYEKTNGPVEKE